MISVDAKMPDRGAAQLAAQTVERHQIDRREGVGGIGVEIGEVSGVQTRGVHQVGEQLLVHQMSTATGIFIELDRNKRRLCLPYQSRDREGVRIGFLEVIQRAVHEVLPYLPRTGVPQVVRTARAVDRFHRQCVHRVGGGLVGSDLADAVTHRAQERVFEAPADIQQPRIPFPAWVYPGEAPVVQFVADERANCMPRPYGSASQSGTSIGRAFSAGLPR